MNTREFVGKEVTIGNGSLITMSLTEPNIRLSSDEGRSSRVAMDTSPFEGVKGTESDGRNPEIVLRRREASRIDCSLSGISSLNKVSKESVT